MEGNQSINKMSEEQLIKVDLGGGIEMMISPLNRLQECNVSESKNSIENVISGIEALSKKFQTIIKTVAPDEMEVEFMVGIKIETNGLLAVLVKSDIESSFKITLKWKKE